MIYWPVSNPPAHAGNVIVRPGIGRRFHGYEHDAIDMVHQDLADLEIDAPCSFCWRLDGTQRCDYLLPEKNFTHCNRRMCRACAVHITCKSDRDFCRPHAKELGILIGETPHAYVVRATS